MKNKNGKIELMRFIFAICILFRHINLKVYNLDKTIGVFTLGTRGYMGVEFFFLVSGYLMAYSIYKNNKNKKTSESITKETIQFLWKKIKGLLPYHLIVCLIMSIVVCLLSPNEIPWKLIAKLPSVFFLQNTGILGDTAPLIAMEWYLSAMLLAMAIIYPLCKKNYELFSQLIAPLLSLFILGYMVKTTGYISGASAMLGLTMKSNLRAIAVICLGISCFEVSRKLSTIKFTNIQYIGLKILENICYTLSILYMFSDLSSSYEIHCLILLTIAVTLTFSDLRNSNKVYNNKFIYFLGEICLPIYLIQELVWECVIRWMADVQLKIQAFTILSITLIGGILMYLLVKHRLKNKKILNSKNR